MTPHGPGELTVSPFQSPGAAASRRRKHGRRGEELPSRGKETGIFSGRKRRGRCSRISVSRNTRVSSLLLDPRVRDPEGEGESVNPHVLSERHVAERAAP